MSDILVRDIATNKHLSGQTDTSHLEVVEDQSGAEDVRVHAHKVRLHGVHHHLDPLAAQSQVMLLQCTQQTVNPKNPSLQLLAKQPQLEDSPHCRELKPDFYY